jgi:hypothetical protein
LFTSTLASGVNGAVGWGRVALYKTYRTWCRDSGRFALAASTFNQHLVNAFGDRLGVWKRTGRPGWLGLGLAPEVQDEGDEGDVGDADSYPSAVRARHPRTEPSRTESREGSETA